MFYKFVLFALIFAMSIVYIDAGHRRCPAMETPKTTSTSTTTKTAPVVSVNPELCNVKYMNPPAPMNFAPVRIWASFAVAITPAMKQSR